MNWKDILQLAEQGSPAPDRRVEKTDEEWRKILSPEEYRVTRLKGTEHAFSGEYCEKHEPGLYACKCCNALLFNSENKFDSGTGWPSFSEAVNNNAVKYEKDTSYGMLRLEVQCNCCDAHLGHVFPDGPAPSGLRFCINSLAIRKLEKQQIR